MHIGLNLLYIIPGHNGGTQTYAESLIKALAALETGDEFTVFVSEEGAALTLPEQPNFRKVVCPVRAARREARYVYEQTAFVSLLKQHKLDVLHSLGYVCPLFPPCRSVVTIHDLNYLTPWHGMTRQKRLFLGWFVRQSARRANAVLTVSQFSKSEILRHFRVPERKITVTLEGPREALPVPSGEQAETAARYGVICPYVMAFGSISGNKNSVRLVQAFAAVHAKVPHTLLLVGHLPPGTEVQAEIKALSLEDRVKITGYVPDNAILPLLEHADLFVFPSLYEGFGLPVLEAQQVGVPVICSNAASLPEVAGNGVLLFDPASVPDLAAAMMAGLQDQALRRQLIERGLANVQRFSWKTTAQQTLTVYRSLF